MNMRDLLIRARRRALRILGLPHLASQPTVASFVKDVDKEFMKASAGTEMGRLYYGHEGRLMQKWNHYLPVYERHLGRLRENTRCSIRLLEIGVYHGGSLQLWRNYFGPTATIFGVDIEPRCRSLDRPDLSVRIGSQEDPGFLRRVVEEMGGVDVIIDDGSHVASHQRKSFETLFPILDPDGIYIVEDLHTSYWPVEFEGGLRRRGTFIEETKSLVDDMHRWYHSGKERFPGSHSTVDSIHIYDSIVVIEKKLKERPFQTKVGTASF